ncbi:MAG: right-handed parallel beta-helix repeat-containing protein [Rikenellaceae bacterium]
MKKLNLAFLLMLCGLSVEAKIIHVSPSGSNSNKGTAEAPYRTISKAALVAVGGDSVIIHEGTYRERVSPTNGGLNPQYRITYMAAEGATVNLKGSDEVSGWKKLSGNVWQVTLPNEYFGDFNPYDTNVFGDWLHNGKNRHLGEVYIDGEALCEMPEVEEAKALEAGRWSCNVDDINTTIYANFDGVNPNKALTEINVRPTCFTPYTIGVDYITVDGLNISQAATQWSPPTGEQVGIINPNWSKGWIIKNCDISYSKCVGICIGKERSTGHNMAAFYKSSMPFNKSGFSREIETIISAVNRGWSKETVGSHLIENNKIYECGQAGIVGHLGCAFSTIRNNEITDINYTEHISGFETGGIKLHAAIDVVIEGNVIVNCRRGIWLDWQAQCTHVRGNIFDKSISEDLFIEVSHGPTLVYNNIMLSEIGLFVDAQGILFANNLIYGKVKNRNSQTRYTPYHMPHSTQLRGFFNSAGGDLRFYNNLFLAKVKEEDGSTKDNGINPFDAFPPNFDSPKTKSTAVNNLGYKLPIATFGNVYYKGGTPYVDETSHIMLSEEAPEIELIRTENGDYKLSSYVDMGALKKIKTIEVNTEMLGQAYIPEQVFDNPDGTPFIFDVDFFKSPRNIENPTPGPFESKPQEVVWKTL